MIKEVEEKKDHPMKGVVGALTEENLVNLQLQEPTWAPLEPSIDELEYPCNDKSSGVTDFNEWKFFKDRDELLKDKKIVSIQRTHIWCDDLVNRVNRQSTYLEDTIREKKEKLANTPLNRVNLEYRMRIQRAKAAAGRYSRAGSVVSKVGASQGTATNASRKNQPSPKKESFIMKTNKAAVEEQVRRDKIPGKERTYTTAPMTSPSRSRPGTNSNAMSRNVGGKSSSPNKAS